MVFKWKKSLALQQKSCKKGSRKASFFFFHKKELEQKMERNDKICYNEMMQKGVFMDISVIRQKIDANREKLASFRGSL